MIANWNLVDLIFGSFPAVEVLISVMAGPAGVYELYFAYQLYSARNMPPARDREAAQ